MECSDAEIEHLWNNATHSFSSRVQMYCALHDETDSVAPLHTLLADLRSALTKKELVAEQEPAVQKCARRSSRVVVKAPREKFVI